MPWLCFLGAGALQPFACPVVLLGEGRGPLGPTAGTSRSFCLDGDARGRKSVKLEGASQLN